MSGGLGDTAAAARRLEHCGADPELLAWHATVWPPIAGRPAERESVAGRMTAYLAGVQERLRQAELARAAEEARTLEARENGQAELGPAIPGGIGGVDLGPDDRRRRGLHVLATKAPGPHLSDRAAAVQGASSATRRVPHPSISPRGRRPATPWGAPLRMQATRAC